MTDTYKNVDFEHLITSQIHALATNTSKCFESTLTKCMEQGMYWFNLDRLTLFPNSLIFFYEGNTLSVSHPAIPKVDVKNFQPDESKAYLQTLAKYQKHQSFGLEEMKHSKVKLIRDLYWNNAYLHGLLPLKLSGYSWGTLGYSRFFKSQDKTDHVEYNLSDSEITQLESLCNIWLVYWQHTQLKRYLFNNNIQYTDDRDKLLKLTRRQMDILALTTKGKTAKQCAEELGISFRTVETHKLRIMSTLELETQSDLIHFAIRNNI